MKHSNAEKEIKLLTCWKEIAQYMGKGVRTVQRWERDFGLPVRRLALSEYKGAVAARSQDLDAWLDGRWSKKTPNPLNQPLPGKTSDGDNLREVKAEVKIARDLRSKQAELLGDLTIALESLVTNCNRLAKRQ